MASLDKYYECMAELANKCGSEHGILGVNAAESVYRAPESKEAPVDSPASPVQQPHTAIELLRQLFYLRLTTGVKLEEIVMEHQPDMWRDIHSALNGQ